MPPRRSPLSRNSTRKTHPKPHSGDEQPKAPKSGLPHRKYLRWVAFGLLFAFLFFIAYFKRNVILGLRNAGVHWKEMQNDHLENAYGVYSFEVINTYHHDPHAFTQGLLYAGNDTLYESTGLYGRSSVRKVHLQTGMIEKVYRMNKEYFGEGLTLLNHRLYQVAWLVNFGFMYEEDKLTSPKIFQHPMKDGWGLATDGDVIYGSDGSSTIYAMQPSSFSEHRKLMVKDEEKEIHHLNELEIIGNELWANIWMKDCVVRISPQDGKVLGWILLHDLRTNLLAQGNKLIDVLNGIAWDKEHDKVYVTGKFWPKLYEIKVHPHPEIFEKREDIWKRCNL